jgi:SAM-dependent methyltransferase
MDHQELNIRQFGAHASSYLASPVHATGADLDRLAGTARQQRPARALDLGCGAGHAAYALARGGGLHVTAYDPSPAMLAVVAQEATKRGHLAIETVVGSAEKLPFDHSTFDLIVTRYSAHHWISVPQALAECTRVLAPRGRLIVIDVVAPEAPLLDTSLQVLEFLRDGSHVRDYRISEWRSMQLAAGFTEPVVDGWKLPMDFATWTARIGTPPARIAALQAVLTDLPREVREYFKVDAECSFAIDSAWLEAPKFT